MPDSVLQAIADQANMIIAGFAFTAMENGFVRVLNLENPEEACVLDKDGNMIETTMNDLVLALVQAYYMNNREFMEAKDA